MSNLSTIVSFLESKGLSKNAIAGVLGNLNVESGLNPSASNPNEGAIGIAQWEDGKSGSAGRRSALRRYAAAHGTTETDLNAQLGFLWQEMEQRGTVAELQRASSPGEAAALFDQHFEVSSGAARTQRVQGANQYAASGSLASASSTGNLSATDAVPTLSPQQRASAIKQGAGDLYSLALAIPELHQLLNNAITTGQTASEFQNAVENSQWYRQHSDAVREAIVLKQSDPATYQKNLRQAEATVNGVAQQLGVTPGTELVGIATRYMAEGWTQDQLLQFFQKAHVAWNMQGGAAGQAMLQMKQAAADYGVPVTDAAYGIWAKNIATGAATLDNFKQRMIQDASSIYPGLAQQLAGGQTTKQLADPYVSTMSQLLELDPNTIKWSTDPLIKRALQTPVTASAGAGAKPAPGGQAAQPPGTTPLWQFEQQLRQDPRWQYTDNAKSATASLLTQLGKDWGMAS